MTEQHRNHEKLWTPANVVTLLRICFIPVFVIALLSPWPTWFPQWPEAESWKPVVATCVFIALAATDALDGYLARSRGEVTNLGKFMDPIADKVLVAAALLALIELNVLPSWVALIILTREFIVSGIRMVAASEGTVIAASWYGKAKTMTQIIAIVLFLIKDSHMVADLGTVLSDKLYLFSWFMMIVALVLTIVSMLDYFVKARELLGFTKHSDSDERKPQEQTDAGETEDAEGGECVTPDQLHSLAQKVLDAARQKNVTLGTAESCTGGLIASTLTEVPGSSDVVAGGIVSYANEVKHQTLGVLDITLKKKGAVSEETACEMAAGARKRLNVDIAVSVTGIAGPGGAVPGKPVGTVWVGLADSALNCAQVHHFEGNRQQVRLQTVQAALQMCMNSINALKPAE